jgi:hypothetical protein
LYLSQERNTSVGFPVGSHEGDIKSTPLVHWIGIFEPPFRKGLQGGREDLLSLLLKKFLDIVSKSVFRKESCLGRAMKPWFCANYCW